MLVSTFWEIIGEYQMFITIPTVLLALLIRVLVPRMMKAEKAATGFALGILVFLAYTLILLLMIWFLCFEATAVVDCLVRACLAVMLVNLMMLFAAVLFFISREKRTMTQEQRMKLKDM